jgi:GMP synthase-like glutamine amidotransferase
MPILVFQHHDIGTPGRLGLTLRDHGHKLRIVRPDKGEPIPPDLDDVSGIVALGGPQNVDENLAAGGAKWPWMAREMDLLRRAHERQLPIVGVCLGHQMLAAALGGEVSRMDRSEQGFHDVTIGPMGHTDTILAGIRWTSPAFMSHGRQVTKAPPGSLVLAATPACKVQAFRLGLRTYGFQWHFECDRAGVDALLKASTGQLIDSGLTAETAAKQADEKYPVFARVSDRLCVNLATMLFPVEWRDSARRDMPEGPASVVMVR